ncbi:LysR family transcriptional regulator [Ramlibacter henchirensis]|uniref:LysR family transcriptional regulator n=1 Tax=Ramlibacter henchirensis TaxID=204072 RepID=A0A4Z0BVG9_9BURK|nr:LysR family transcriptional regulator [Ramlibacter henchirensis]TFZ02861.1 LysR family transcriptional regulator [Ramlibacter henchirensis]
MDLRRVRHFNVLAETLNFSRAAERLHIAQPALSVSIQKLESELGTRLFERTPTGVLLTPSGKAALVEARRLLYHGEQLLRTARDSAAGTGGRLRIGFVGSAIYRLIPSLVQNFRSQYPGVELVLTESTSVRIMAMLHEEALDIGIVRTPLLQSHAATLHTLQRDRFVVALPAAHPLAASTSISLARLAGEAFVMYSAEEATGLHASAMAACEAAGFVPEVRQLATQVPTMLGLVESGLGVALVPEVVRGQRAPHVVYCDLEGDGAGHGTETTLALAWHRGSESPAAQRFIDMVSSASPHSGSR